MHFPMELGRYQRARKKNIGFGVVNNVLFIWNFLNVIVIIIIIIKWMRGKEDKVMTGDNAVAEKRKNTHTKIKIVSFGFIYLVERILAENCLRSLIIYMSFYLKKISHISSMSRITWLLSFVICTLKWLICFESLKWLSLKTCRNVYFYLKTRWYQKQYIFFISEANCPIGWWQLQHKWVVAYQQSHLTVGCREPLEIYSLTDQDRQLGLILMPLTVYAWCDRSRSDVRI